MSPIARRNLIIAIIIVGLAAIGILLYFLLRKPPAAPVVTPQAQTPQGSLGVAGTVPQSAPAQNPLNPPAPSTAPTASHLAVQQTAGLFAERYGSYSNQDSYQNLRDLLPLMTASYRAQTEAKLAVQPAAPAATYEGVTSVKLMTKVAAMTDAAATVDVTLQQTKVVGTSAPQVSNAILELKLVKEGEDWKVDGAAWR